VLKDEIKKIIKKKIKNNPGQLTLTCQNLDPSHEIEIIS
jgi:hypothetical protein